MFYANELLNVDLFKDKQLALILKDALVQAVKGQLGKCMKVHTSYLAILCEKLYLLEIGWIRKHQTFYLEICHSVGK